jgi:hypothetical protein
LQNPRVNIAGIAGRLLVSQRAIQRPMKACFAALAIAAAVQDHGGEGFLLTEYVIESCAYRSQTITPRASADGEHAVYADQ